jgi:hypothetical protein
MWSNGGYDTGPIQPPLRLTKNRKPVTLALINAQWGAAWFKVLTAS